MPTAIVGKLNIHSLCFPAPLVPCVLKEDIMSTAIFSAARSVDFYADHYDAKYRAPLGAVSVLFTARATILADGVVSVRFQYPNPYEGTPASLVLERLDGQDSVIPFPRTPDAPIVHMLEWSLNREAAMQDARRINALACRMERASVEDRYVMYEYMASLWHAFERAVERAWDTSYCECPELHPAGDWVSPCRRWRRLDMSSLISGRAARFIYEAVALEHGLPMPSGDFDSSYGRNNLPYLSDAMDRDDGDGWAYRLYVCFSGPAPECAAPVWHCVPSHRFGSPEPDPASRFDAEDDPSSPVRGHAVRLA